MHLAHDASNAQLALDRHEFQVVLLDMKLHGQDSAELIENIRRTNRKARTIIITGDPAEVEQKVQRALASGAEALCYKPFDIPALLDTVKRLAQNGASANQAK